MDFSILGILAVTWVAITSLMVLLSQNWRISLINLALQYLGVFLLVVLRWPFEMSVAKLVSGWMASAVLAIAASETFQATPGNWQAVERFSPSGRFFRLLAATLVWLTVLSIAPKTLSLIPEVGVPQAWGGLLLIGMGLIHLGMTAQALRVIIGLLTTLSGFEVLYAAVESSALMAGLLAATHMGLALTGAFLLVASSTEESV